MRTSRYFFVAVAIVLATVSCSNREELDNMGQTQVSPDVVSKAFSFGAASEGSTVKSFIGLDTLSNKLVANWEDLDQMAVYDGVVADAHAFGIQEGSIKGGSAVFEGEISESAETIVAVYPLAAAGGLDGGNAIVTVPSAQVLDGQNVASGALVTVGKANCGEDMVLRNVCGLLAVEISYDNVTKFTLTGTALSGTAKVNPVTGEIAEVVSGENTITVTPADEVFKKGVCYVAVLPGTTAAGSFKVTMFRKASLQSEEVTAGADVTIPRNGGLDFKKLDSKLSWALHITNKEELLAWNATTSYANDMVYLDADIDLAGETWTPKKVTGTFDGQNHRIYNVVCQPNGTQQTDRYFAGFFTTMDAKAVIKDLVLGSSDGASYDGTSIASLENTDRDAWSYIGGVVARMEGGEINNVKSFIKVELGAADVKKAKIGGIAGTVTGKNSRITDCENHGEVVNNASTSTTKSDGNRESIGGITSTCEDVAGVVISGCANYGNIISNNPEVEYVGGIIAVPNGPIAAGSTSATVKAIISVKDCVNYGDVTLNKACKPSVGGVVGCLCAAKIENCTNLGTVSSSAASELKIGGIAGKFTMALPASLVNCTNGESGSAATKGQLVASTGTATAFIGGILGNIPAATTGKLTVTGCTNYADVTTSNTVTSGIGGFGGYWNATGCVVELASCNNYGNVTNAATATGGDNRVGGFVGNFANASGTASSATDCCNYGNVTTTKPMNATAQVGGFAGTTYYITLTSVRNEGNVTFSNSAAPTNAMNVGGIVGYASASVNMKDCSNSGKIEISSSKVTGNGLCGGIAGNIVSSTLDNCDNSGTVCVLNGYSGPAFVGGLAGYGNNLTVKNGSDNTGTVYSVCQKNSTVGGIIGAVVTAKVTIDGSKNTGEVYASKTSGQFLVGGIMGDGAGLAADVKNCVNEGAVHATQTGYAKQYFTVGGIVGRSKGKSGALHTITNCVNRGTVTVTANTDNQLCNAGGIVGETNTFSTVTGNVNEATGVVSCTNNVAASYATRTAYAGGISGGDNEGTVGAAGNDTVTGNTNYADVTASVTNGATAIGAGGVFGMLQRTGTFTGNKVYGTAQITTVGTAAAGGAGAILGYYPSSAITGVSAEVQKTVTVGGTAYADAESAGTLATWLCPTAGADVTATYID